jgi:GMP synthase (glutamine-hydrolysing)
MRLLVLNCDLDPNATTNGASLLREHLSSNDVEVNISNVFEGRFPGADELRSNQGIVITGSRASAYDKLDWIPRLCGMVRDIDRLGIPTLGICFGFQITAQALGGKVEKSGTFESGFDEITLKPDAGKHFLFEGFPERFKVYQSHGDVVSALPQNSVVLSEDAKCIQAYYIRNIHCVQFHPEITPRVAKIMALRDSVDVDMILNSVGEDYALPLRALSNFVDFCRKIDSKV